MHLKPPHFIVVTDRGALRAGWIQNAPLHRGPANLHQPAELKRAPTVHWVEELSFVHPRQHLVEQLSDMAGAYSSAASSGASASGGPPRMMGSSPSETHWRIEADRHAVEDLAQAAASVLAREKPEAWSLSAPVDIHHALVDALPQVFRERLARVLPKNLADMPSREIVGQFLAEAPLGEAT